ncbi:nitroreductase family deazaflavin-dependent oxidoreductase [uncultured Mycolicibacterium sp.]|uniref:nitroreductase family deazaflavin-dependent oxidoreductase n=1 Tax=uncultured Mycolicibacterium sp. TaxID=2320817 RepID=UPI00261A88B0|nr:nitroreductase family deazaflavin-dependent oxidoreductase [uncultured Mycolicibacterium sp.]
MGPAPLLLRVHDRIYQRTGGYLGHRVPGIPPSLLLHTTGARTGRPRTRTLTYARDGRDYLIVASNGGADRHPAWYHNLRKHPRVEINVGPHRMTVQARFFGPDDPEYPRLWRIVNDNNANRYEADQRRTSRPIPVIALRPTGVL